MFVKMADALDRFLFGTTTITKTQSEPVAAKVRFVAFPKHPPSNSGKIGIVTDVTPSKEIGDEAFSR